MGRPWQALLPQVRVRAVKLLVALLALGCCLAVGALVACIMARRIDE